MYAFLSNQSACDALRYLGNDALSLSPWPQHERLLPLWGDCVSTQRAFKQLAREVDLPSHGLTSLPVDLLVPSAADRSRGKLARMHVWKRPLPTHAFWRLEERLFVSHPSFVLVQMAGHNIKADPIIDEFTHELRTNSEVHALAREDGPSPSGGLAPYESTPYDDPFAWARKARLVRMALVASEFCGTYRLAVAERDARYRLAPLTTREDMRSFALGIPHLYGASRVRAALDLAFDRSASPRETALSLMLSLPVEMGGYGLARPSLNEPLPTGAFSALWDGGDTISLDLLWKDYRLVIEYESDEFHARMGAAKATSDAVRANVLSTMGYTVLRATPGVVGSRVELDRLARQVALGLGAELATVDEVTLMRRNKLRALLLHQ